ALARQAVDLLMPTSEYLREQAARCRRLAAHVRDRELQQRLLDLAEEYERKVAGPPGKDPDSRLGVARGHPDPAEPSQEGSVEELENEKVEP
ncbi:MAG: hypothetical protein ACREE1_12140, partial [Stellaceae bacterium]